MSSQLIFLVALVAGCFANSIIKGNEAPIDVPNLWVLEVDVENITSTRDLSFKRVIYLPTGVSLELEYGRLSPIFLRPVGNNGRVDDNVTKDFDISLRVPLVPQIRTVMEGDMKNAIIFPYSSRNLDPKQLPLWEMDFNKWRMYSFEGPYYQLMFSIRKVKL